MIERLTDVMYSKRCDHSLHEQRTIKTWNVIKFRLIPNFGDKQTREQNTWPHLRLRGHM